jgi:hypothetical protein
MRKNGSKAVLGRPPSSSLENELRRKVAASLTDPRKNIPASKVFKRLRELRAGAGRVPYSSR